MSPAVFSSPHRHDFEFSSIKLDFKNNNKQINLFKYQQMTL